MPGPMRIIGLSVIFSCSLQAMSTRPAMTLREALEWEPHLNTRLAFNITTNNSLAQRLFQIGLMFIYNFDQNNALAAFNHSLGADKGCAMCAWGYAHACGPFLNAPRKSQEELRTGFEAARQAAVSLTHRMHSPKEDVLINSMLVRYPSTANTSQQVQTYQRYAQALHDLRVLDERTRDDPDLKVFEAEALLLDMCDESGYNFYIPQGDDLPPVEGARTGEARNLLREALATMSQQHPYAHHLLIHVTEMSNALAATVVGDAARLLNYTARSQNQHLQHMTTHTFMRTGMYHEAIVASEVAVNSDIGYLHHGKIPYGPGHDAAFLVCAALWAGERATAYRSAAHLQQIFAKQPEHRDAPDGHQAWAYPMLVAIRFGDWHIVHDLDVLPPGNFSHAWSYGYGIVRHFSRAIADVHLGLMEDAATEIALVQALMPTLEQDLLYPLAKIANHTVTAVWATAHAQPHYAVDALKAAVEVEMALTYDEPPEWLLPSRECYGQALLNVGRHVDAEAVFREALNGFSFHAEPHCGWALFGLRESLRQQQDTPARMQEIEKLTRNISKAWEYADVPLTSSCLHLGKGPFYVFA